MFKLLRRIIKLAVWAGLAYGFYKGYRWYRETTDQEEVPLPEASNSGSSSGGDSYEIDLSKLGGEVSKDLLDILVCPLDKGPLELVDGKWLVNRRNGYRYPIVEGIPIMLIEVGEKYKDESLITEQPAAETG